MKTLFITIFVFGILSSCNSQSKNDFSDFYNTHEDDIGIITFSLPIGLANAFIADDDAEAKDAFAKVSNMKFFICEKDNGYYEKKIKKYMPEGTYHDLMVVKNGKESVSFKMKEPTKGKKREVVLIITEPESFVAISFVGNFTLNDAKEMANSIETDELGDIRM